MATSNVSDAIKQRFRYTAICNGLIRPSTTTSFLERDAVQASLWLAAAESPDIRKTAVRAGVWNIIGAVISNETGRFPKIAEVRL